MPNLENLIPGNERSQEELRENGRKGGIASGKARREKRILKEAILRRLGATDLNEIVDNLITRSKDCSKDLETLRDTIGEKPIVEADVTSGGEPITGFVVEFVDKDDKVDTED